MFTFIAENFTTILAFLLALGTLIFTIIKTVLDKKAKRTGSASTALVASAAGSVAENLSKIYKMLPSLVTFSETMNQNKTGAAKKEFVLNYIKQTFAMLNFDLDDETVVALSGAIDDIVAATKQMHAATGAK